MTASGNPPLTHSILGIQPIQSSSTEKNLDALLQDYVGAIDGTFDSDGTLDVDGIVETEGISDGEGDAVGGLLGNADKDGVVVGAGDGGTVSEGDAEGNRDWVGPSVDGDMDG